MRVAAALRFRARRGDPRVSDVAGTESTIGRRLAHGSLWALSGKLVAGIALLVSNFVLARMLTPAEFGAYLVLFSMVSIGSVFAQLGMGPTAVRLVAGYGASGRGGAVGAVIRLTVGLCALGAALTAGLVAGGLGTWFARELFGMPHLATIAALTGVWLAATAVHTMVAEVFRGFHDVRGAVLLGGTTGGLLAPSLATAAFLYWWRVHGEADLPGVLAITAGVAVLILVFGGWALRRRIHGAPDGDAVPPRTVIGIALPLWGSSLAAVVMIYADVWILGAVQGNEPAALYGAAARLAGLVALPFVIANAATAPLIAELYTRGELPVLQARLRAITTVSALPAVLGVALFVLAGGPLMAWLYGSYYRGGETVLAILAVGQLVNVLTGPCGLALMMTGRQLALLAITLVAGAVTVLVGAWAARHAGSTGLALAMSGGLAAQNVVTWWVLRAKTGLDTRVSPASLRNWRASWPW